ncbi:MAG TPA: hypothetical protein ENK66_10825, partial [Arcobacter sp.]|nr:hypothetical protein [Arcobacter sp.]
ALSRSAGISLDPAVSTNSTSASSGNGQVKRNEKLTLRIAATVVGILNNGVLKIQGTQEVRVNYELRELLVTGHYKWYCNTYKSSLENHNKTTRR